MNAHHWTGISIGTFYFWTLTAANVLKYLEFVLYSLANTSIRITCAMDTEQQITRCGYYIPCATKEDFDVHIHIKIEDYVTKLLAKYHRF